MNERFRELAEQVDIIKRPNVSGQGWDYTILHNQFEEFAKLIIKECISICEDMDGVDNFEQMMHPRTSRYDCAEEIKEHFGVE